MRSLEDLCDRTFDAIGFGYFLAVVRKDAPESAAMQEAARNEVRDLLGMLEHELDDREYFCGDVSLADFAMICDVPMARTMKVDMAKFPRLSAWMDRMRKLPAVAGDRERLAKALATGAGMDAEFEGPDGRIHWRDSRLEWPVRHGFIDLVAREFHAGKMMFPPDAS